MRFVIIPEGTKEIGEYAFKNCDLLTSIELPNSLEILDNSVFWGSGLTSITIPPKIRTIAYDLFYTCYQLTSINFPDDLQEIESGALINCSKLTKITLPSNLGIIEDLVFAGCKSLIEIHSLNPIAPQTGKDVFRSIDKNTCKIYVPKGSYDSYNSNIGWAEFKNIIEE